MATKIIFVAVAVMCTFGALDAKQHLETQWLKLTPAEVIAQIDDAVVYVTEGIAKLRSLADQKMSDATSMINDNANDLFNKWNSRIDEVAKVATDQGLDITKCLAIQKQLSSLVDQVTSQSKQCTDAQQKSFNDAFAPLEAFVPKLKDIAEEAKKDVAQCDLNAGTFFTIICMMKTLAKNEPYATDIFNAGRQYLQIRSDVFNKYGPNILSCASQSTQAVMDKGDDIVTSTINCIEDLLPWF